MALIRKAFQLTSRRDRRKLLVLVPLALLVGAIEAVGATLVYSLLSVATGADDDFDLPIIADVPIRGDTTSAMVGLAAALLIFFVAKAAIKIAHAYIQQRIVLNMAARLSTRLLRGYLEMPYPFHLHRNSSDLIRNANQVVREIFKEAITPIVKLIAEAFLIVGLLVVLINVSLIATVLAIVVLGIAGLVLMRLVQPRLERLGDTNHALNAATLKSLQQSLQGIRDIKVSGTGEVFAQDYGKLQHGLARNGYRRATIKNLPDVIIELALFSFILLFFGATVLLGQSTPETLAVLGLFAYAGQRLQRSLTTVMNAFNQMRFATAPIDQIYQDLALIDRHLAEAHEGPQFEFTGEITFDNVRFRYEGSDRNAIDGVSMTIAKGEVIGICGPTGGGKTTFVDLACGLLDPTDGQVRVDGRDVRTHRAAWQKNLGVVPQNVFLIDASLRDNIAFGVPTSAVDEQALTEAIELAQLSDFVASLPAGLDTYVGERGVRVSGGQRQRVAIARALYHRPSVLVFDEGTSALDNVTEREVMDALERLRGSHTILLVAHRLSTVKDASRVVMLVDGRVVAEGPYDELLATNTAFADLAAT